MPAYKGISGRLENLLAARRRIPLTASTHGQQSPALVAVLRFAYRSSNQPFDQVAELPVAEPGCHHILPDGTDLYESRFDWCGNFQDSRCAVRERDGSYLHVDAGGRPAYAARWRYAGDFREGLAVVQAEDGRATHVDHAGQPSHGGWFRDLDVFHKGAARARDESGWTHIDRSGTPQYARRFAMVEPFYNGQARVERFDGALEVIDPSGREVVELRRALSIG